MRCSVFPDYYLASMYELPSLLLWQKGIRAIVFDIDNTIEAFDVPEPSETARRFFKELKREGFHMCVLSNNKGERVKRFAACLGIPAVSRGGKPFTKKLRWCMKKMGVSAKETALVGDQVFTDVLCANLASATSVLTKPLTERDQWITKIKRPAERQVLRVYQNWRQKA